jgi:hypothetical protein
MKGLDLLEEQNRVGVKTINASTPGEHPLGAPRPPHIRGQARDELELTGHERRGDANLRDFEEVDQIEVVH